MLSTVKKIEMLVGYENTTNDMDAEWLADEWANHAARNFGYLFH